MIDETLQQFAPLSDISQGSVATHLRCGRIFSDDIIANFLLILKFENRLIFDKVIRHTKKLCYFWGLPYMYCLLIIMA